MALTQNRDTPRYATGPAPEVLSFPVKGSVEIFVGALVGLDASGFLVPAAATRALKIIGRAEEHISTTAIAGYTDGDSSIAVRAGTFKWKNGDSIARADVGELCFASDDETVRKSSSSGARPPAGVIVGVDTDGVWVQSSLELAALLRLATSIDTLS
jgi:hypothetical protein